MLGKTHITTGIASALIVIRPQTVPGVIATITGGAIGGWIVDVDCKKMDADREKIYDTIIDGLFIGAFVFLDYLIGKGLCKYISDNWGPKIIGGLAGIAVLLFLGLISKHRTFTHSLLCMLLFGGAVYLFCKPAVIAFLIGYGAHLIADLFNKRGIQILFPFKMRPCFKLCDAGGKANRILFWIAFALDVTVGAYLFSTAMMRSGGSSEFLDRIRLIRTFGLNSLQLYLIFINIVTFLGFERNYRLRGREILSKKNKRIRIDLDFEVWLLDFLVFIGGGIGMLVALTIHLAYPGGYNGNWWAMCYTSVLLWFTVYCYVCNPFGFVMHEIKWVSLRHIPIVIYLIAINLISALLFSKFRKDHLNEYSLKHTLLLLIGALGGTVGGYPIVILSRRDNSFNYAVVGFPIMLIAQITFIVYMMSVGIV